MLNLLDLPAELRNRIYELVLDASPDIFQIAWPYRKDECANKSSQGMQARPHVVHIGRAQHFNQLQFVCQQIRRETSDLELKGRSLVFLPSKIKEISTIFGLKKFVSELGDGRIDWVKNIFLHDAGNPNDGLRSRQPRIWLSKNMDKIFEVLRFCKCHQEIQVRQTVPYLSLTELTPDLFIFNCILIIWTFREAEWAAKVFPRVGVNEDLNWAKKNVLGRKSLGRKEALEALIGKFENLGFKPEGDFDEVLFRKIAMRTRFPKENGTSNMEPKLLELWVHHAKRWMKWGM
jgi:hypothetical protein